MSIHPRVQMFLRERDRALARQDWGVYRSLTADLRRLGVRDDATLANPAGPPRPAATAVAEPPEEPKSKVRHGKLPRCEHDQVADRCQICNEEIPEG